MRRRRKYHWVSFAGIWTLCLGVSALAHLSIFGTMAVFPASSLTAPSASEANSAEEFSEKLRDKKSLPLDPVRVRFVAVERTKLKSIDSKPVNSKSVSSENTPDLISKRGAKKRNLEPSRVSIEMGPLQDQGQGPNRNEDKQVMAEEVLFSSAEKSEKTGSDSDCATIVDADDSEGVRSTLNHFEQLDWSELSELGFFPRVYDVTYRVHPERGAELLAFQVQEEAWAPFVDQALAQILISCLNAAKMPGQPLETSSNANVDSSHALLKLKVTFTRTGGREVGFSE